MIGQAIEEAFVALVVMVVVVTATVTAALIFGVPWLWGLIKPWLHALTA